MPHAPASDHPTERGVTLVEALLALSLLSLALVGLAGVFPAAGLAVSASGARTSAVLLAEETLAIARSTAPDGLRALVTGGFAPVPGAPGFHRSVAILADSPSPGTSTVLVTVRVESQDVADTLVAGVVGP